MNGMTFHFLCDDLKTNEELCAAEGAAFFFSESISTIFADMMESFCIISCRAWSWNFAFSFNKNTVHTHRATTVLMSEINKDLRITKDGCIITPQIAQTLLTAVEKRIRIGLEL